LIAFIYIKPEGFPSGFCVFSSNSIFARLILSFFSTNIPDSPIY
jgi:hypothetical protein